MTQARELVRQTPDVLRARHHPWIIAGLWGWHTALAIGASWPAASLARAVYGTSPWGDAELWRPGGYALLDFLWHERRALAPLVTSVEIVAVVGAITGLVPMAASMFALTYGARHRCRGGFTRSMMRALRSMPVFLLLLVIATAAQIASLGLGFLVAKAVVLWFESSLGEATAERLGAAVGLVFALIASGLGVVHDLARAVVVRSRARALRALVNGARVFGSKPLSLWWSWAWRSLASVVPMFAVGWMAERIGGRGGAFLLALAVLHQSVVVWRVAFHVSWLAKALRATGEGAAKEPQRTRSMNPSARTAL